MFSNSYQTKIQGSFLAFVKFSRLLTTISLTGIANLNSDFFLNPTEVMLLNILASRSCTVGLSVELLLKQRTKRILVP